MGKFIDFAVQYNPVVDSWEDVTKRILYNLIVLRNKGHKPNNIGIFGESGEGKSLSALRLQELLLEMLGLELRDYLEETNIFTPFEYSIKVNKILGLEKSEKDMRKINILCMHEAREIVKAKEWHTFLSRAVSDVNAMSRSIKRLTFIIISQFIRDITTDIRYTLNYYITAYRPIGKKCRLTIHVLWKDDKDLERPRLRKRLIRGYLIAPDGSRRLYCPKYLEMSKPHKDIIEKFEKLDFESKAKIIRKKLDKLLAQMRIENEAESSKINAMVTWYMEHDDNLNLIGHMVRKKFKVKPEVSVMHDLNDSELKDFQDKLNDAMLKKGVIAKIESDDMEDDIDGES